jgi:hypothetical protein
VWLPVLLKKIGVDSPLVDTVPNTKIGVDTRTLQKIGVDTRTLHKDNLGVDTRT